MNRKACVLLLSIAMFAFTCVMEGRAETLMTRHVREVTLNGQAALLGRLPATQNLRLDVVLPLRDPAGLDDFLAELYNPESSNYRQFLTPTEFTERFGPTQQDYDLVVRYVEDHGLAVVGGSRDGMEVQVKGPVSAVESAFNIKMMLYQHPTENRLFYGPDREPTTGLPFALWHISGLDNYSIPHPKYVKKTDFAKAHGLDPNRVVSHATTGSGPDASFLGSDMRAAYYGGTALTGAGQNVGLLEYLGTDLADLNHYYRNVKQTLNVPITLFSTDGTSTRCVYTKAGGFCDDTEQTLDMTQS
ncbi:MAG TPA: protease pro-enzyme activation domain-containing protein, partial [Candidatus Sulfotelmatobacter sp.]